MNFIMAVAMKESFVTQLIIGPISVNMVNFHHVFIAEQQATLQTSPCLSLEKFCLLRRHHRVLHEPFTPIEKVSIIGTGGSFYFGMPLDFRPSVPPHHGSFGCKHLFAFDASPVFPIFPVGAFVWVPFVFPLCYLSPQYVIAFCEDFC